MLKDAESIKLRNSLGFIDSANPLPIKITDGTNDVPIADSGAVPVNVQYGCSEPFDLYLYKITVTLTITSGVTLGDTVINVVSTVGVNVGDVITFYEGTRFYQSLVMATTETSVTVGSPIDYAYTTSTLIEVGLWNMAIDGSTTTQIFSIKSPPDSDVDIHSINCSITDSSEMDSGKFGGIPQLSKGIIFRFVNSIKKNLALVVNNLGFWEIGFDIAYDDKAPAGTYGFKARRHIPTVNGVILKLVGDGEFQVHIQDDLTDLDLLACSINGNVNTN